jgi:thiosulfate/3-mercaptopyruvate sulfurtransferase
MKTFFLISFLILSFINKSIGQPTSLDTKTLESKIVSVEWLANHINDPDLVILHVSPLRLEYNREHIPGARFLWNGTLTISTPYEAAVPVSVKTIKKTLEELGISNNSKIVLTFMNGLLVSTCRTYLMLDYIGLGDQTYILSGGVEQWKAEGKPVVTDIPVIKKGKIKVSLNQNIIYNTDQVLNSLNLPNMVPVDARAAVFYEGKSGVPRAGRIPGAKNLPIAKFYEANTIKFFPIDILREEFQKAGIEKGNELITYCFVGNAASLVYFVARELGYKVHLYDGSMDEWGNRFELPLEKTEESKNE